jgi:hypothetical protein
VIGAGDDLPKEISTMFYYSDPRALCEHIKGNWLFVRCGGFCVAMLTAVVLYGPSVN